MNHPELDDLPESDDLDAMISTAPRANDKPPQPVTFVETCSKCHGSGRFHGYSGRDFGPCHKCKGRGQMTFRQAPEKRAATRQRVADRKNHRIAEGIAQFQLENPEVWTWMNGNTYPFAVSLRDVLLTWGYLTDRQLAAAVSAIEKRSASQAAAVERIQNAVVIDMSRIEAAFARASTALKRPKLRLAGLVISPARLHPGTLYVTQRDPSDSEAERQYLGKILQGKFVRSRECTDEQEKHLLDTAVDPLSAAVTYGRLTGNCSCCGRVLINAESVARGIGPICASQWGW